MNKITISPDYASIECIRDICDLWIAEWDGDEWGYSMRALHAAAHTSYGFSDEDCALFASKLMENLNAQKEWMEQEGYMYDFRTPDQAPEIQEECRIQRDYWRKGGNLTGSEHAIKAANETLNSLPGWLFGEDD